MLNQDFREFVQLLNDKGVRYLVVGGYAVAYHGHPRYTKDLDVWVDATAENARRVLLVLAEFGFGSLDFNVEDFTKPDSVIQLGYPPGRIDLINQLSGVRFDECYPNRVMARVDDVTVPFIDLKHLIQNKRASGRHQDLADAEALE